MAERKSEREQTKELRAELSDAQSVAAEATEEAARLAEQVQAKAVEHAAEKGAGVLRRSRESKTVKVDKSRSNHISTKIYCRSQSQFLPSFRCQLMEGSAGGSFARLLLLRAPLLREPLRSRSRLPRSFALRIFSLPSLTLLLAWRLLFRRV
jgi:hypothetical protein